MQSFYLKGIILALAALASASSHAQSGFNIDLDIFFGNEANGNGAPDSSFSAASGQSGFWNRVTAGSAAPETLRDLSGNLTGVVFKADRTTLAGGSNFPINTGNYSLLLNDYARIPDEVQFHITGLTPGQFKIYTYGVDATGATRIAEIFVPGSTTPNPQMTGQGPMPGNSFAIGLTHCVHTIDLTSSTLAIIARNHVQGPPNASINGFQIIAVPEPLTIVALVVGGIPVVKRRKRNK